MTSLFIFYDDTCGFCCRCAEWLREQPTFLPVAVLPASQLPVAGEKKAELVAIDDAGGIYRDTDAWLVTLWALRDFRPWSLRLSRGNRAMARKVVALANSWRHGLTQLFSLKCDIELKTQLESLAEPNGCEAGEQCELSRCKSCTNTTQPGHPLCAKCLAEALRA